MKGKKMTKGKKMISLYIPTSLFLKLQENKRRKGTSVTFQIIDALEKYLKS